MHKQRATQKLTALLMQVGLYLLYLMPALVFAPLYFVCNKYFLSAQINNTWVAFACGPFSAIEALSGGNIKINLMNNFVIPFCLFIFVAILSLLLKKFQTSPSTPEHPWLSNLPLKHWEIFAYPVAATYLTSITSWLLTSRIASGTSVIGVSLSTALESYLLIPVVELLLNALKSPRYLEWKRLIIALVSGALSYYLATEFIIPGYFSPKNLSEVSIELHGIGMVYFAIMWLLSRLYPMLRARVTNY